MRKNWQKRCSERWLLLGDANTCFFHRVAYGRKHKCTIFALEDEGLTISDPGKLRDHVESFYKKMFGREERGERRLEENFWENCGSLSEHEADSLVKPFSEKEIKEALDDMKTNSALGPNGLPAKFYKYFWEKIKNPMLEMFERFHRGGMNISKLNYGLIPLIPKMKEANNIRQYRPTCLLG
jgi:hypothetical protein